MSERVWDRFLSESDKTIAGKRLRERRGFGERPVLLLVDLYRSVFGDEPEPVMEAMKKWPASCGLAAWKSLPHIESLLATAREVGIPVIHVVNTAQEESSTPSWAPRQPAPRRAASPEAADRMRRSYDIIDELTPLPGEPVIRKAAASAFFGTSLVPRLNALQADTLIVVGESTSGCVRASVVDGSTYKYKMTVVEECVFDRQEVPHAINLYDMNQKYADVVPLVEVRQWLHEWGECTGEEGERG